MNNRIKIPLYIVLGIMVLVSGSLALSQFKAVMNRGAERASAYDALAEPEPEKVPAPVTTNETGQTNTSVTNASNLLVSEQLTNQSSQLNAASNQFKTNLTNQATALSTNTPDPQQVETESTKAVPSPPKSRVGLWTAVFVLSMIGLGLLIALDVSHYVGNKSLKVLYNEDADGMANPEYEAAEQTWANGQHLEAIRMMREYLDKNPREQFVAIRIAEIYEKDLGNYLAAALEYEEVLKHKLPPERWGWAAIHLCNLYFKLNQEDKAVALLRRITSDYSETPAATKARKRLEAMGESNLIAGQQIPTESDVSTTSPESPVEESGSNLPPGFRPKK